jgi:hypothetical protein
MVSSFFNNSTTRFGLFEKQIKESKTTAHHTHVIDVCRTRWLARMDSLDIFLEVYQAVINSLLTIKYETNLQTLKSL